MNEKEGGTQKGKRYQKGTNIYIIKNWPYFDPQPETGAMVNNMAQREYFQNRIQE